ncbi:MAG: S8 family serine peptidase, partial [Actinotalea sp.]|nr:S8 family serine peptidase [Actinotalea sp.]
MLRRLLVTTAAAALAVVPVTALAAPPQQASSSTGYAIVTFTDAPLATYTGGVEGLERTKPLRGRLDPASPAYRAYERYLANERASYKAFLAKRVPGVTVIAEYDTVLNGVAVELNGASLTALRSPKVANVQESWTYRPTMNLSPDIINAPAVWDGLVGEPTDGVGVDVGIIDSGIRADHEFFACKEAIPHKVYASGKAGPGPDIVFNHGTHVAGTVAGCVTELGEVDPDGAVQGTISGVAPGADLHDYNVFPGFGAGFVAYGGSAFSHDIARAVEDAVDDGMDVINMSLGGTIQGPHDYLAEAVNAAAAAGVVVAVSAGNEGPGPSTIGSPGNAVGALTSGATTNRHYIGVSVVSSAGTFGGAVGDFDPFADHPVSAVPLVAWPGTPTACTPTNEALTGAVVLIQRGTCTFETKVAAAAAAGAAGVLVYNNTGGDPIAMGGAGTIPALMVSQEDGAALLAAVAAGPVTVSIDGTSPVEVVTNNADIVAGFSSRGHARFTENIKPDVVAPGVNIYSSAFDEATGQLGWTMMQGTSMASPHTAGAAALLLAQRPALSPTDVKSVLGNTAERTVWSNLVGGRLAGVMERGGGRIDLARAAGATVTFDPMSLSFGTSKGNRSVTKTITVTVSNLGGEARTLELSQTDPRLTLSTSTVELPANGTATFSVTL